VFSATAANLNVRGNSTTTINAIRSSTDATGPNIIMRKARGTSASQTAVATGDNMGTLVFSAFGGTNNRNIATIASNVELFVSDSLLSSNLTFSTASASSTPTEVMRIDSTGKVGIGTASPSYKLEVIGDIRLGSGGDLRIGSATGTTTSGGDSQIFNDANNMIFATGTTSAERMRIDSSGNVGIGTTGPTAKLTISQSAPSVAGGQLLVKDPSYSGVALVQGATGEGYLWNIANSYLSIGTNSTERMRIDSSGRVLVGYSSNVDGSALQVDANSVGSTVYTAAFNNSSTSTAAYNAVRFQQGASGSSIGILGTGGSTVSTAFYQNRFVVGTQNNTPLCFSTNDTFRGMIDGGGQFWWGSQTTIDTVSYAPFQITNAIAVDTGTTTGTTAISFFNGQGSNTRVGYIGTSGSSTSYNTSSDARLKENIEDADDTGAVIDAIQVRQFDWKINAEHQRYGMIAQELVAAFPEAVSHGPTEEDMLAVDYSKFVPMLVKEVQSLRARVGELEGK
jgi:hypothetical protein